MALLLDEDRVKAILEQMPATLLAAIEEDRVTTLELLHASGKIRLGRPQEHMKMIGQ